MAKEIYKDDKRSFLIDGGVMTLNGKNGETKVLLSSAYTETKIPQRFVTELKKMGESPEGRIAFYQRPGAAPLILPKASQSAVDTAIKEYKAEIAAIRNDPANIERNAISKLYSDAHRIENSDSEDNVEIPNRLRSEARRRLEAWRVRYPDKAQEEDADKLIAKAKREEELASGALVYDADGLFSQEMQQKRHDEFMAKAKEYRKEAQKLSNPLTTPQSGNIMTSTGKTEKEDDSRERSENTGSQSRGLSSEQSSKDVQRHDQERGRGVLSTEIEAGEGIRREPHSERSIGTGSMEQGNPSGDTGKRERLENKSPGEQGSGPDNAESESLRPKQGMVASGRDSFQDLILTERDDIGHNASAVTRWNANIDAIKTLKQIETENRQATTDEQKIMTKFSGWGASDFGQAFPLNEDYRYDKDSPWGRRRDELKSITTPEEFKSIEGSRLNAFFTTPEAISTMWKALERAGVDKLKNPRILEPSAGSGRFLGYQPPEMAAKSERIAVELDSLTGRMLKQMYPKAEVYAGIGFERAPIPKESIDVAISNVPFGDYAVFDPTFKGDKKKLTRSIHNYFFAKTLEELRPGGMLAFITSHYTMDSATGKPIRQALAKEADLVEAIRLPNNAFPDTQVVTDIIIMKKRMPGEKPGNQDWVDTVQVPFETENYVQNPITKQWEKKANLSVNKYFIDHPDQVLGIPSAGGTMRGRGVEYTVDPPKAPLLELLKHSIGKMPDNIIEEGVRQPPTKAIYTGHYTNYENSHVIQDGKVYIQHGPQLEPANFTADEEGKVKDLLAIRDVAKETVNIMVRNGSAVELEATQNNLNTLYKAYVLKYGALSAPKNIGLMEKDPDAPFLRALENNRVFRIPKDKLTEDEKRLVKVLKGTETVESSDLPKIQTEIFSKRVIHGYTEKPVTDYADAESVVKNETGRLDIPLMAQKLGKTENEVIQGLTERNLIYKNPQGDWEPADEYLTGDVRAKLRVAEAAANGRPKEFNRNVEALKAVQPEEIPAAQIGVRMGAPWIPASDINRFTYELLDASEKSLRGWGDEVRAKEKAMLQYFRYNDITGEWKLDYKPETTNIKLKEEFGTQKYPAHELIEAVLNGKLIEVNKPKLDENGNEVTRTTKSGKVEVVMERDDKETIAAQDKAKIIQDKFHEWLWSDPDRTERLAKSYNDKFNNFRPRIFNGQHQILPGLSEKWSKLLHNHSKDAIWRVVQERTALLAHEVGFGKSNVMAISGHELRRLGLANKVLYVVPKATHAQFRDQYLDDYPFDKVLFPTEEDFATDKRAEFASRIQTGDHDAIILSYEQFEKIPVKPETEKKYLQVELDELEDAIQEEAAANHDPTKKTPTQKQLEASLKRAEERLQTLNQKIRERSDKTVYFDDLGIDQLYVDEADNFKNLHFTTRMGRVKGLPNGKAQRAWDMYTKTRLLQENKNSGVVFATGTPIANTIAEMYTNMRYLQEPLLKEKGLQHFDAWAKTFGETTESIEQTPTGQYKMTQRFAKFQNAPELSRMWQQVADIRVSDEVPEMLKQRPRIVNEKGESKREVIAVAPDTALLNYMKTLAERADKLKGKPEKGGDNMLKISGDARKASLDMRLVDGNSQENPNGKINVASAKIAEIYNDPFTKANRGTQLVFLDMGTPKAKSDDEAPIKNPEDMPEDENEETAEEAAVLKDVYGKIKKQLIANGVPENKIAFIHDAKNQKQRTALADKVISGDIQVLIGSTGKMGAGLNVQDRAVALHHLDAPWRPRDIEQREGRVIRAGNKIAGPKLNEKGEIVDPGKGVKIYTYVTEKSFDAFMWQAIEVKSKAIKAIMRRNAPPRSIEDVDSFTLSAGEAKAIASGDPDVMKQVTLKNNVTRYQMLKSTADESKMRAKYQLKQIPEIIKADMAVLKDLESSSKLSEAKGDKLALKVGGQEFSENKDGVAENALRDAIFNSGKTKGNVTAKIGEYRGFDVLIDWGTTHAGTQLILRNPANSATYPTSQLPLGVDNKKVTGSTENVKLLSRLDNAIRGINASILTRKSGIQKMEQELTDYKVQVDKPFKYQDRLDKMKAELDRINRKLQGEKVDDIPLDNNIDDDIPEDNAPAYHYGNNQEEIKPVETINPKAEIEAVKAEVTPVEKELEVKPPPANIEKIVKKMAEPVKEEPKPKLGEIGDEANIMGVDSVLADSKTIDDIRFDIFNGAKTREDPTAVRVIDTESGEVISLKQYPSYDSAEKDYKETVTNAKKMSEPATKTEPKSSIDNVPADLPEIKNAVDTTKEKNVVYGALNDPRNNAQISKDMGTNTKEVVSNPEDWKPAENDLSGWDTTDVNDYQQGFAKVYPGAAKAIEDTVKDGDFSGRVKTLESMVKKLKKKNAGGQPFTQNNMEDIIGTRITFDNQKDIMAAAQAIKSRFPVTSDEDYISHPKDGYRSYHLTVKYDGKPVEIQLRTPNQTKWADWMHDTFYDHPAETKARLGEEDFKKAKAYSLAMADYYAKLDKGEPAVMPEPLKNHPEFMPKGEQYSEKHEFTEKSAQEKAEHATPAPSKIEKRPRKTKIRKAAEINALSQPTILALPQSVPYGINELKGINAERKPQAQTRDIAKKHSVIITPEDPRTKNWIKHPGKMDIIGVDAPKGVTEPTVKPKITYQNSKVKITETTEKVKLKSSGNYKPKKQFKQKRESRGIDLGAGVVRDSRGQHIRF